MRAFFVILALCFVVGGALLLLRVGVGAAPTAEPHRIFVVISFWAFALILGVTPFTRIGTK